MGGTILMNLRIYEQNYNNEFPEGACERPVPEAAKSEKSE